MRVTYFPRFVFYISCFILLACKKNNPAPEPPIVIPPVIPVVNSPRPFFEISGSKIVDTNGVEFIGKGVNVNGPKWPWSRPTIPDVNLMADVWKCNIVRVNCWPEFSAANSNNIDLEGIINSFTAKKVVIMLEDHNFTGKFPTTPELNTAITWWKNIATKYKNNGYVWFNLMNEPGGSSPVTNTWLDVHTTMIEAIRSTGAKNIIVCDENHYGQANGFDDNSSSAAITYGQNLTSKFSNILFSLHLYDNWIYGENRLKKYLDAVKAKNLAVIIGEYGVGNDYSMKVTANVLKATIPKNIGRIAWHWVGEDFHKLASTNGGGGWSINNTSGAKPTNLSFAGNLVWMDTHNELSVTDPALETVPVIFPNADFEFGSPVNASQQIDGGWINFGTAQLDNAASNVKQGNFSVRIKSGSAGGCGVYIYLKPGETYKITAWGKHSATPSTVSNLGLKYKTTIPGAEIEAASLSFNSTSFEQQTAIFTVPAQIEQMFLYIYKNDAASAFWCDDIIIEKQ